MGLRSSFLIVVLVFGVLFSMIYFSNTIAQQTKVQQPQVVIVRIVDGASDPNNPKFLDPQVVTVVIGVNNTVRWVSEDTVPHTITSDSGYKDPSTGMPFNVRERPQEEGGPFVMPGNSWEFTFTQPGEYGYHGEPHPWMRGTVIVLPG